jgi:hypothetical protein
MRRVARLAIVLTCGLGAAGARAAEPVWNVAPSMGVSEEAIQTLLAKAAPADDSVPVDWRSSEVRFSPQAALRIRIADPLAEPGARPLQAAAFAGGQGYEQNYELSVVHDWPAAFSFDTQRFGLDLTPHAGVGVTTYGGMAEAGATLQFKQHVDQVVKDRLGAMGVKDGTRLGDRGRWYLFAAASGRSVGLNMLRGDAGWTRAGWTTDRTSTMVGDAQVGVGWRKGDMQTSLGYIHREIKGPSNILGQDSKSDSLVAFTFSVKPGR